MEWFSRINSITFIKIVYYDILTNNEISNVNFRGSYRSYFDDYATCRLKLRGKKNTNEVFNTDVYCLISV
jgi:hypothetical protein